MQIPDIVKYTKLSSAGNDFICLDNTSHEFTALLDDQNSLGQFAAFLCRRGIAVGADGVILACSVEEGSDDTVIARFIEPDGSEAKLCGNGTACFTYWVVSKGLVAGPDVQIVTRAGVAYGRVEEDDPQEIRVCVPDPKNLQKDITIEANGQSLTMDTVDTGVPHAVIPVADVDSVDVGRLGAAIRHHPEFAPKGINANFVQILGPGHIAVRTFEFGVESETLACGTGSAAAAIITCMRHHWDQGICTVDKPVEVLTRSGETLRIYFNHCDGGPITDVCLETRVRPVYDATLRPELIQEIHHRAQLSDS